MSSIASRLLNSLEWAVVVGQLIEQLHLTTEIRGSNPVIDILFTIDFNIKTKIKEKEAGNGQNFFKKPRMNFNY